MCRRFIKTCSAVLAASILVSGCAASSGDASQGTDTKASGASGEKITLRILENDTAKSQGYLDELLTAFNKAYADQGIEAVDANMEEYSNLAENGPYGYGPDVLYQANDQIMTYAEDKHIMALSIEDFECYDKVPKEAFDAFKIVVDGKDYYCGVPVNVQEPMLFYRADKMPENWEQDWDCNGNKVADFFENWNSLYAYSNYLRQTDPSSSKDSQYGLMAPLNDLYMMAEFSFSYGGYVFGTDDQGSYDPEDIGFNKGDSAKGLYAMKQFASLMSQECIDDSVKTGRYSGLADGTYFCTISTPDTYTLFYEKLVAEYEQEGLSTQEAKTKASENLMMVELPSKMPADADITKDATTMSDSDFVDTKVMGGVNGYAISAYTKYKDACIKFIDFATSYDMITKRADMLGIAPTRSDVATDLGGVTDTIFTSLKEGNIYLMPSVKAVDQIWDPMQTLLADVAKDAFRASNGETEKYTDAATIQTALDNSAQSIYDAIYTLAQ